FSRHRSIRQLMEELVTLIDDHTEYFRGHLIALAKTERRVYLAVLDLWRPSSAGEIATRARRDIRTVSALLGRLVNRGVVTREGRGRKRRYAAAERLYSIYFKLRRERGDVVIVRDLVRFMVAFYGTGELYGMSARLISEVAESAAFRKGFARALSNRPPSEDGASGMKWEPIQTQEAVAAALIEKGSAQEKLGDFEAAVAAYDEAVERLGDLGGHEVQVLLAGVSLRKGNALARCGNLAGSIAVYDQVIERFAHGDEAELRRSAAAALISKGASLGKLGDHGGEIAAYGEVLDRFDDGPPGIQTHVAIALSRRGMRLAEVGRAEEALQDCEELEREFGALEKDGISWFKLHAMCVRAVAGLVQKRRRFAMEAFNSAYAAFTPCNEDAMQAMLRVVATLIATGARVHELVEIMTADEAKSEAMAPLVVALRQQAGEIVRAPVEVLEVAADIRNQLRKRMGTSVSKSC
ncbi:MAG: hypothetical protein OXH11_21330, partial [Candidatus Aminicenantes bacterium]|nr:hypothetical protein [Candidatus Aminicenantes bacterium]